MIPDTSIASRISESAFRHSTSLAIKIIWSLKGNPEIASKTEELRAAAVLTPAKRTTIIPKTKRIFLNIAGDS